MKEAGIAHNIHTTYLHQIFRMEKQGKTALN